MRHIVPTKNTKIFEKKFKWQYVVEERHATHGDEMN